VHRRAAAQIRKWRVVSFAIAGVIVPAGWQAFCARKNGIFHQAFPRGAREASVKVRVERLVTRDFFSF